MKKSVRTILGMLAALGLIFSLTACDPPNTQVSDKMYTTIRAQPLLQDGETPYIVVIAESKAPKMTFVEVTVDDGVSSPNRTTDFILTGSPSTFETSFSNPVINVSNSYGVDVYVSVWNWDNVCGCRSTAKIETHNIQNLVFAND